MKQFLNLLGTSTLTAETTTQTEALSGMGAERIESENRDEKKPIASNARAPGRAQNRRVEIEVSGRDKP